MLKKKTKQAQLLWSPNDKLQQVSVSANIINSMYALQTTGSGTNDNLSLKSKLKATFTTPSLLFAIRDVIVIICCS